MSSDLFRAKTRVKTPFCLFFQKSLVALPGPEVGALLPPTLNPQQCRLGTWFLGKGGIALTSISTSSHRAGRVTLASR